LYGCELVQHAARGESGRERFELLAERDVQAVGEKGDEDTALRQNKSKKQEQIVHQRSSCSPLPH
jgi:hypothetical protein